MRDSKDFKINVVIEPRVLQKVMFWVQESKVEVSGMGKVIWKDGAFRIIEAYLLEQENGPATTDIDAEAMSKLMFDTIREEGHLNWWWHSHVNMDTFWSGTDLDTIKELGSGGMCLATVFNKKEENRTAFFQQATDNGFLPQLFIDNIRLKTQYQIPVEEIDSWRDEFKAKCRETKPKVYNTWGGKAAKDYGKKYDPMDCFDFDDDDCWDWDGREWVAKDKTDTSGSLLTTSNACPEASQADLDTYGLGLRLWQFVSGNGWFWYDADQGYFVAVPAKGSTAERADEDGFVDFYYPHEIANEVLGDPIIPTKEAK